MVGLLAGIFLRLLEEQLEMILFGIKSVLAGGLLENAAEDGPGKLLGITIEVVLLLILYRCKLILVCSSYLAT